MWRWWRDRDFVRVFISHSAMDNQVARRLKRSLSSFFSPIQVWEFGEHKGYGQSIWADNIRPHLERSDVFLLVCSGQLAHSPGVARELGLFQQLRAKSQDLRPVIIPVLLPGVAPPELKTRDFDTGAETGSTVSLEANRCFVLGSRFDSLKTLRDQILPKVRFFGTQTRWGVKTEPAAMIPASAFTCYETLFPIRTERDDPNDIKDWLGSAYDCSSPSMRRRFSSRDFKPASREDAVASRWAEIFACYEVGGSVVGMGYYSIDRSSGWVFGNYFGVLSPWRQGERAQFFHRSIEDKMRHVVPNHKGYLFEVETVDIDVLLSVARKATEAVSDAQLPELSNVEEAAVRAYRRLKVFSRHGAFALTTSDGSFVHYRQPAMQDPIGPEGEVELILLIKRADRSGTSEQTMDAAEIFSILYDGLFRDYYDEMTTTKLDAYATYLARLKTEMIDRLLDENASTVVTLGHPLRSLARSFADKGKGTGLRLSAVDRYNDRVPL